MELNVRRAEEKDAEDIGRILYEVHAVHHAIRPDLFLAGKRKYDEEGVRKLILSTPVLVAEDESGVLGYAVCFLEETPEGGSMRARKTLYLDDLCVDEAARKRGVGHKLFAGVEALAREMGCYDLTLNVWEGNDTARAFYDSVGMKPLKTYLEKRI